MVKTTLQSIASRLNESDIREIIRIKKLGDRKAIALRKKRDAAAAALAKLDAQLAELTGETEKAPGRRPGRRANPKVKKTAKAAPVRAGRGARKSAGRGISAAVREVFRRADKPLKARQIVDDLPATGFPVADVAGMRKRVSIILSSQKSHFEQVERGIYRLKD